MNKTICTVDCLLMSMVSPYGLGNTELIFLVLASPTIFYPAIQNECTFFTGDISLSSSKCRKIQKMTSYFV